MACADGALIGKLKGLVHDIEGCCWSLPPPPPMTMIPPTTQPFATCCMVCPPPILAPTLPEPVKPLALPCPNNNHNDKPMSQEEAERSRNANFYNNYNIDWHADSASDQSPPYPDPRTDRCNGSTLDGKSACCENSAKKKPKIDYDKGCPTGFKPCTMKLTPPAGCHPCGVWCAEVQPCPPKTKKKNAFYEPGACMRPCCKHWKPKDGECKYDEPCKAHCFEQPPGGAKRRNALA